MLNSKDLFKVNNIRFLLLLLFLFTWFIFGLFYQNRANKTSGEAFIFQEDIKLQSQINAVKKSLGLTIHKKPIKEIIICDDTLDRHLISPTEKFESGKKIKDYQPVYVYSDKPIGSYWGAFYNSLLESKGADFYKIMALSPKDYLSSMEFGKEVAGLEYDSKICYIKVEFYQNKDRKKFVSSESDLTNLDFIGELFLLVPISIASVDDYLSSEGKGGEMYDISVYEKDTFHSIYNFHIVMSQAFNFLDYSPVVLIKVLQGDYSYPLLDFLYFSAVTITTLGYGDILPNSTHVRLLVMIESFVGLLIIGCLVSTVFWKRNK